MGSTSAQRVFMVILITALLAGFTGPLAFADEKRPAAIETNPATAPLMIVDFVAARPVGLAALGLGSVFFVASLPFSIIGGNTDVAFEAMIKEPARYTFLRPLGSF